MIKALSLFTPLAAAFSLAGCTAAPEDDPVELVLEEHGMEQVDVITSMEDHAVIDYEVIDRENLIIVTAADNYLVRFMTPCFALENATGVGFSSATPDPDRFDHMVVQSPVIGTEQCNVEFISRLGPIS